MSKVAVVFWSGTGNTETMANAVSNGAKDSGAEVKLFSAVDFKSDFVDQFDAIAFGCPSMGSEVLEEDEFEPMWDSVKGKLSGKKIVLFGSYDWGDGEWMRNWEEECKSLGAVLASDFVICNLDPDDTGISDCEKLGSTLA